MREVAARSSRRPAPSDILARVPPHDQELEGAVIGAVLFEESNMAEVASILQPAMFHVQANSLLWQVMQEMYTARAPIDIITVKQWAQRRGVLADIGGAFYISRLSGQSTSSAITHLGHNAYVLVQYYIKREEIRIGHGLIESGHNDTVDPFDSIAGAANEIRMLNEHGASHEAPLSALMAQLVDPNYKDRGVGFGFPDLDQKIKAEPGTVTIVAARPAMGKTAFMLSSAWRQAKAGQRPYIAQMEMKSMNLFRRLAAAECQVPVWKMKRGLLSDEERMHITDWMQGNRALLDLIQVNEASTMTTSVLAACIDRAKRRHAIDVVWVDYMGLMQPSEKQRDAYHRMTKISNELRVMAKDIDLPFLVLAQLSRPRKDSAAVHRPSLTDLRDSGEIEQDAEAVLFLHRPDYYMDQAHPDYKPDDTLEVIIGKHRDGDNAIVNLAFDGPGVRVLDRSANYSSTPALLSSSIVADDAPF